MKYKWKDDSPEISGMGGGYEQACRDMLVAGLEWWDEHPDADPKFHGYRGIYGVMTEDNEDAKLLSKVVVDCSGGDCTGAMHQAVISTIFWIRAHSWEEYITRESERKGTIKGR